MNNDARGEVEIYEYFSDCLKLFMKKMMLINRIMHCDCQEMAPKLQDNLSLITQQAMTLIQKFGQLSPDSIKDQPVCSRFVLRVKESVHNFYLKASTPQIVSYLKFIQSIIKEFTLNSNIESLLKIILLKTPAKLTHHLAGNQNLHNNLKLQELRQRGEEGDKTGAGKDSSHFNLYDRYLEALDREYRLFDCLNIEESHYRRTFFMALEDQNRNDNNLYEEMMYRNRYTKESLRIYQKQFENNKRRLQQKKQKLLKTEISLMQFKQKKNNFEIVTIYNEKNTQNASRSPSKQKQKSKYESTPKRLKTEYDFRVEALKNETLHNFQPKKNSQSFKQSLKTQNKMQFYASTSTKEEIFVNTRVFEAEKQNVGRNMNYIHLKKVQFRGTRIELAPEPTEKKSELMLTQQQRRRKLNSRANEHFRKKISFITQPRTQKSTLFRSQELHTPSNNKQSDFNQICINNCKLPD